MLTKKHIIIIIIILFIISSLISSLSLLYKNQSNKQKLKPNKLVQYKKQDILDKIVCMVTLDNTILVFDNDVLIGSNYNEYNNGIYFVTLSKSLINNNISTNIRFFDTIHLYDINYMKNYINSIQFDDLFIILSKGYPFNIYSNLGIFKTLGSTIEKYTNKSNYLLIGSKKIGIYYESISENPIIYPQIGILESICKVLPTGPLEAKPLKQNLFYSEQVPNDEKINRCALETSLWGYNRFGIANNRCIPISDKEFNSIKKLNNSDQCVDGIGNIGINIYKFVKLPYNKISINNNNIYGVKLFSKENYKGFMSILNEGEYNTIDMEINAKSIIIPKNYHVFITYHNNSTQSIFGKKKLNIKDDIDNITIKLIKDNSVILSDETNNMIVLDPGKHVLDPALYSTITDVKMSVKNKQVILYKDIGLSHIVQTFNKSGKVLYPVIIRSVQIL